MFFKKLFCFLISFAFVFSFLFVSPFLVSADSSVSLTSVDEDSIRNAVEWGVATVDYGFSVLKDLYVDDDPISWATDSAIYVSSMIALGNNASNASLSYSGGWSTAFGNFIVRQDSSTFFAPMYICGAPSSSDASLTTVQNFKYCSTSFGDFTCNLNTFRRPPYILSSSSSYTLVIPAASALSSFCGVSQSSIAADACSIFLGSTNSSFTYGSLYNYCSGQNGILISPTDLGFDNNANDISAIISSFDSLNLRFPDLALRYNFSPPVDPNAPPETSEPLETHPSNCCCCSCFPFTGFDYEFPTFPSSDTDLVLPSDLPLETFPEFTSPEIPEGILDKTVASVSIWQQMLDIVLDTFKIRWLVYLVLFAGLLLYIISR